MAVTDFDDYEAPRRYSLYHDECRWKADRDRLEGSNRLCVGSGDWQAHSSYS